MKRLLILIAALTTLAVPLTAASAASASAKPLGVTWMKGYDTSATPAKYNQVGVIKVGPSSAKNVLVLEPGTSAGSAYFVPLAKWIVSKTPGWQVWSVERRENLLEDQSELTLFKDHKATPTQLFNYYLGYLKHPTVSRHFKTLSTASVTFAKDWGMATAVGDLHSVISATKKLGGKVVLGGHSLGGSVVTAYATWDFTGKPGADQVAGLVYIDGASFGTAPTTAAEATVLQNLDKQITSPWLSFGGIPSPYVGLYNAAGSAAALLDPNQPSLGQQSGLLPKTIVPPVPVSNAGQYGYALNVATSPISLVAAQAHLGTGLTASGGWNSAGALVPLKRYATMFSGEGMANVDGTEWYFPQRLTDDTAVVDNGNANPAQQLAGVHATMGQKLPKSLLMYAFGAHLGGSTVLNATEALALQSGIPAKNLTLVTEHLAYAHNDPAGAYPKNIFFDHLVPFLKKVG